MLATYNDVRVNSSQHYKDYLTYNFIFQMENSAYAPNPLPPPALVVFSQAGNLPDALRMQRPFNTQVKFVNTNNKTARYCQCFNYRYVYTPLISAAF